MLQKTDPLFVPIQNCLIDRCMSSVAEPNPITWMLGLRICPGFSGCPPTGHIFKCYKYPCTLPGRTSSNLGKIKYITGVNCCRVVLRSKFASHYQLNLYRFYFAMVICGWEYEHQRNTGDDTAPVRINGVVVNQVKLESSLTV